MNSIVISCGGLKQAVPARARDLYIGISFVEARDAAIASGLPWAILSAKYGLISPEAFIEPYDADIGKTLLSFGTIAAQAEALLPPGPVIALCSKRYAAALAAAIGRERVVFPMNGLPMGKQRKMFREIRDSRSLDPVKEAMRHVHHLEAL